jgi:hypothetical protein
MRRPFQSDNLKQPDKQKLTRDGFGNEMLDRFGAGETQEKNSNLSLSL